MTTVSVSRRVDIGSYGPVSTPGFSNSISGGSLVAANASSPVVRMILSEVGGANRSITFYYSPVNVTMSNIAWQWDEVPRSGTTPYLVNSQQPTPHIAFDVTLGYVDWNKTITSEVATLKAMARQAAEIKLAYTAFEAGLYRIVALTVDVTRRHPTSFEPTLATVSLEFAVEPNAPSNKGPVSGGAKATKASTSTKKKKQVIMTTHIYKKGETLAGLAKKYYKNGGLWKTIAKANKITHPKKIKVGTKLKIPKV